MSGSKKIEQIYGKLSLTGIFIAFFSVSLTIFLYGNQRKALFNAEKLNSLRVNITRLGTLAYQLNIDTGGRAKQQWHLILNEVRGQVLSANFENRSQAEGSQKGIKKITSLSDRITQLSPGESMAKSILVGDLSLEIEKLVILVSAASQTNSNTLYSLNFVGLATVWLLVLVFLVSLIVIYVDVKTNIVRPIKHISRNISLATAKNQKIFQNRHYSSELMELVDSYNNQVRKNLESCQNLEQQSQLLKKALKARESFFINLSHEIRTPLNGICGFV